MEGRGRHFVTQFGARARGGRATAALKRVITVCVICSLVVLSVAGCSSAPANKEGSATGGSAKAPYRIGAILSLTGTYAGLGAPEKNTLEMEVARINEAGGVNGHDIEVVIVDDATDPAKAASAASKLIEQDKVAAIIGATGTGQTMAVRAEVDRAAIPQVSIAGGTVITQQFDALVFQTPWSNTLVVPFTLARLKTAGIKKVALLSDSGGFGKDGQAVLKKALPDYGMTAVADETFNPGDTDVSAQLTKIKGSGAQAVLLWNAGKEAATVAKGMAQLKIAIPLVGSHGNARREFIDGAGEAAEGFTFAAGKVLIPESYGSGTPGYKVATEFIDRYTKKYGKAPDTFAGHAYDALYLIVDAMKGLPEGFTPAQLRDGIEKTNGFVGVGGTFTFSPKDHNGMTSADLVTYKVEGGKWTLLK